MPPNTACPVYYAIITTFWRTLPGHRMRLRTQRHPRRGVPKAAAEAGKAIVCEKPMEITPEKIADVIGVVELPPREDAVHLPAAMMPVAIAVKQAVAEGRFGRICLAGADLKYYRDQAYYNSAGWRGTWEQDGGGA